MSLSFGILVFPQVQQLDLTGPYEVFASVPDSAVHLIWKNGDALPSSTGLPFVPTATFETCPPLDVLCIPGGSGVNALLEDEAVLDFVRARAAEVRYLTSVCTGALILGAAGLLRGRRATTYWSAVDLLPHFGATPVDERVVIDGDWVFAAGVTAGIDGALRLAAILRGEDTARAIQLMMQYAPEPPFDSGSPHTASPETVAAVQAASATLIARREATARAIAHEFGIVTGA